MSMTPISKARLAVVRRILKRGGTLLEAANAIGCTRNNIRRLAMHYNLPRRTCPQRRPQTSPKRKHATYKAIPLHASGVVPAASKVADVREYWAVHDPSVVRRQA